MAAADPAITLSVQRLLGDRSYEKRKTGAISVEESVRGLKDRCCAADLPAAEKAKLDNQIRETITQLGEMFCRSPNANHRKGGLIGLAGAAIGLMEKTHEYLNVLLPPVLHCFQDPESRVRYYACESLFNIAKVSRNFVLAWFPKIFSGLCQLYSDVDVDVKNGAQLLDRLVKEIVTESTDFDVDAFIPLLQRKLKLKNPYIRQLLLGWISVFDSIPKINMLSHLPSFLEGLFSMLNDEVREIRLHSDQVLMVFLGEIKEAEIEAIEDLLGPMVDILVSQCHRDIDPLKRHTAMTWLHDFIGFGRLRLKPLYAKLLHAVLGGIADEEKVSFFYVPLHFSRVLLTV
jgi:vacuole morphology and inheritance protein 14